MVRTGLATLCPHAVVADGLLPEWALWLPFVSADPAATEPDTGSSRANLRPAIVEDRNCLRELDVVRR